MTNQKKLSSSELIKGYKDMLLVRRFEEKCTQLYGMGLIGGFCHLYIGQEAIVAGLGLAKSKEDSVITAYRCHAHAIICGMEPKYVLAELLGKETGCSKGKGGSMHMFSAKDKFYGGHGIVGASAPLGAGIAFAQKYNKSDSICYTFFGDGASNQGQVFEAFNMAALWKLPVIFVIENNQYSMGTSLKRSTSVTELYKKGISFGIEGIPVDGMDIHETYKAFNTAKDHVKKGRGPMLIEMLTYRYRGHSMSDPAKYRTKQEVETYKNDKDPISKLKNYLIDKKITDEKKLKEIESEIKKEIQEAVDFAQNSSEPQLDELYKDVYIED